MKFYYVDPPTFETDPEGSDGREWFTSREAADRSFNDWVRRIKVHNQEPAQPNWDGRHEDDFTLPWVELRVVDVQPTKRGLLHALNHRFRGECLRKYPEIK